MLTTYVFVLMVLFLVDIVGITLAVGQWGWPAPLWIHLNTSGSDRSCVCVTLSGRKLCTFSAKSYCAKLFPIIVLLIYLLFTGVKFHCFRTSRTLSVLKTLPKTEADNSVHVVHKVAQAQVNLDIIQ
uniref:Uncharacterized protein n=1 Tax=Glossina brevipalpis TaxID=37001 RepID=A0A1A9WTY1_9MUSC